MENCFLRVLHFGRCIFFCILHSLYAFFILKFLTKKKKIKICILIQDSYSIFKYETPGEFWTRVYTEKVATFLSLREVRAEHSTIRRATTCPSIEALDKSARGSLENSSASFPCRGTNAEAFLRYDLHSHFLRCIIAFVIRRYNSPVEKSSK